MSDIVALVVVIAVFAIAVTTHVAITHGLLKRRPRWHALVAFVVPPLAPYWAFRERMPVRAALWLVSAVGYAVMWAARVA